MNELFYVVTISVYCVLLITAFIGASDISDSTIFEFATAYNISFVLVILYYSLLLWVPHIVSFKHIALVFGHYLLYLVTSVLIVISYEKLDTDMLHMYIVVLCCDFVYLFLHVAKFYTFIIKGYELLEQETINGRPYTKKSVRYNPKREQNNQDPPKVPFEQVA